MLIALCVVGYIVVGLSVYAILDLTDNISYSDQELCVAASILWPLSIVFSIGALIVIGLFEAFKFVFAKGFRDKFLGSIKEKRRAKKWREENAKAFKEKSS